MFISENLLNHVKSSFITKVRDSQLFWILSFSFLTFLAAQVFIPVNPVPFTLQTMLVLLSGAFLGAKNGFYSQIVYLSLGAIGLPVFAGFNFGFMVFAGATGGYLLAFPLAAFITGYIIEHFTNKIAVVFAMFISMILLLVIGAAFLAVFLGKDFFDVLIPGIVIFSVWDLLKISAAASIYLAISKKYPKLP